MGLLVLPDNVVHDAAPHQTRVTQAPSQAALPTATEAVLLPHLAPIVRSRERHAQPAVPPHATNVPVHHPLQRLVVEVDDFLHRELLEPVRVAQERLDFLGDVVAIVSLDESKRKNERRQIDLVIKVRYRDIVSLGLGLALPINLPTYSD